MSRGIDRRPKALSLTLPLSSPLHRLFQGRRDRVRGARLPLFLFAFCLAYFLAAKVGIATSLPPEGIVILWPPNAIVLATLLAIQRKRWWMFFLATVATEIAADVPDYPLWAATGYGIVNFSEAAIAAILLSKFTRPPFRLVGVRDFAIFLVVAPVFASGLAALFGAAIYKLGAPDLDYLHYWRVFWFGDAIGLLIVGTTLLAWRRPPAARGNLRGYSAWEMAALALGLLAAASWAFWMEPGVYRVYLTFPFLLWASLRFGVRGASAATVAIVAMAIGPATNGFGPFSSLSTIDNVLALQSLIAVVSVSTFMLAFSTETSLIKTRDLEREVEGHKKTQAKLHAANRNLKGVNEGLDQLVSIRTKELQGTVARNEFLLRELQHRVKNNLQLLSSILALHARSASDPVWQAKFSEVQGQIGAIAATYDVLHRVQSVEAVDFCCIVPVLCRNIAEAHGDAVSLSVETSGKAAISADTAVALSLALNEVVTNSVKHGSAAGSVAIGVHCWSEGDRLHLSISDNGPGFPPDFDLDKHSGFGLRMAAGLVGQAEGRLRLERSQRGALVEISVPLSGAPN